jgi:outer membrane receptor protein involved in Fe transport
VEVDNLLNREYYTAAQLATTSFNAQGAFLARPYPVDATGNYPLQSAAFFAPGAPRRAWVELRLKW